MTTNIAFFDFDGTITFSDTFTPFIYRSVDEKTLRRGKLRLLPYILAYKMGALSGSVLRKKVVRIALAGKSEAELKNAGLFYSKTEIPSLLREDAMNKINWHKSQGDTVVVVSASLDLYLKPWCEQNGLELLCSEVAFLGGKATGNYKQGDCSARLKKTKIIDNYDLSSYKDVYAYGDTKEDLDMLSLASIKFYQWKEMV